jgi:hypothetical protein
MSKDKKDQPLKSRWIVLTDDEYHLLMHALGVAAGALDDKRCDGEPINKTTAQILILADKIMKMV